MTETHRKEHTAWRWFTGYPLDGKFRTNASWLHRGTELRWAHPVWRWHYLPWLQRGAIRTGSTMLAPAAAWALLFHRVATTRVLLALAVAFTGFLIWRTVGLVYGWRHYWTWHRPLRRKLTKVLAVPPRQLEIARDRSRVVVGLPHDFTGTERERKAVEHVVTSTLAIEADPSWKLHHNTDSEGNKHQAAIFTQAVPPPLQVSLADIRPRIVSALEHEIVLGQLRGAVDLVVSVEHENPHMGLCMPTGAGKSEATRNVSAQALYHGWIVVFLDWKLLSHRWARGLPNVAYAGTVEEIHVMLCWLAADDRNSDGEVIRECELTRRKRVALAGSNIAGEVTGALVGPRILVVAEELNSLQKQLRNYWKSIGGTGMSPAADALDQLMFAGRQLRMHVLQIGQRLSAKATSGSGSADSRENLSLVLFKNPKAGTWRMFRDDDPRPPPSAHKGRYVVVTDSQVQEIQSPLYDRDKIRSATLARELAISGEVAVPRDDMPFVVHNPARLRVVRPGTPLAIEAPSEQGIVARQPKVVASRPAGSVTLKEMVKAGLFPTQRAAARHAQRKGWPSVGVTGPKHEKLYDLDAVTADRAA